MNEKFGLNEDTYLKIKDELDKLNIIYFIDIVFADECSKKELVDSIKKEGVEF